MTENYSTQNTLDMLAKMLADPSNVTDDATDTTPNVDGKRPQGLGRPSLGKREPISGPLQQISYAMGMFNPKLDKGNVPKKVDLDAEGFMTKLQANWDRLVPFKLRGEQLATDAPYKARGNTTFSQEPMTNADASPLLSGTGVSSNDVPTLTPAEQAGVNKALAFQTAEGVDAPKDSTINVDWGKGFGLMARRDVEWGGGFREEFAKQSDAAAKYINDYIPFVEERINPPANVFKLEEEVSNLTIDPDTKLYNNRPAAVEAMIKLASDKYEPLQVAALKVTMDAESGKQLEESGNYKKSRALSLFKSEASVKGRAEKIAKLYDDPANLSSGTLGSDNAILNNAGAVKLFNIAYANGIGAGNGSEASGDGWLYRGRGPIQITGRATYLKVGELMGIGDALVRNPDLLLSDPKIMAGATLAYLDWKGFGTGTNSQSKLAAVIGHGGGTSEAKKRWDKVEAIMKKSSQPLAPTESSRPRSRPEGITTVGKRAPTDSPLAPASSPRPKPRPNSVASNTQKVTSALAERTRRPNSNQGF